MATVVTKLIMKNDYADGRWCVFTGEAGKTPVVSWLNESAPIASGTVGATEVSSGVYVSDTIPAVASTQPSLLYNPTSIVVDIDGDIATADFNGVGKSGVAVYANVFVKSLNVSAAPSSNQVVWWETSGDTSVPESNFTAFWDSSYKFDVTQDDLGYSNQSTLLKTTDESEGINILTTTVEPTSIGLGETVYFMGRAADIDGWSPPNLSDMIILFSYTNGTAPAPSQTQEVRNPFFLGGQGVGNILPGTLTPSRPYSTESFIEQIESRNKLK